VGMAVGLTEIHQEVVPANLGGKTT